MEINYEILNKLYTSHISLHSMFTNHYWKKLSRSDLEFISDFDKLLQKEENYIYEMFHKVENKND